MSTAVPLLRLILYILAPSGGVGKTFIAQLIEAVARLQDIDILVASQDGGSHSLPEVLNGVKIIPADPEDGFAARIVEENQSRNLMLIDVGANPETKEHKPLRFAYELNEHMRDIGGRLIGICPTGSLKLKGLKTAATTAVNMKNLQIGSHLILNQMNPSAEFGAFLPDPSIPVSCLPYLQSGFMEYRMNHKGSLANLITSPPPGYELAAHHFSKLLVRASQTPLFRDIFSFGPEGMLIPGYQQPPGMLRRIDKQLQATNAMLCVNYSLAAKHILMTDRKRPDAERLRSLDTYCDLLDKEAALNKSGTSA